MQIHDINSTYSYLRAAAEPWRNEIRQKGGGRCSLTGSRRYVQVHHLDRSFIEILNDTFVEADLAYHKLIKDYTSAEKKLLADTCLSLHLGCRGVLLSQDMHRKFHERYGLTGYTEDDYREFVRQYKARYRMSKQHQN